MEGYIIGHGWLDWRSYSVTALRRKIDLKIIFYNVFKHFYDFIKYADDTMPKVHIYPAEA